MREAYREIDEEANASLNCSLVGDYQKRNINTARVALDELRKRGVVIGDEAMHRGFSEVGELTGFAGRWTVVSENPLTICDTGHNEVSLRYNMAQLQRLMSDRPGACLRFVIGFVSDKDVDRILNIFRAMLSITSHRRRFRVP